MTTEFYRTWVTKNNNTAYNMYVTELYAILPVSSLVHLIVEYTLFDDEVHQWHHDLYTTGPNLGVAQSLIANHQLPQYADLVASIYRDDVDLFNLIQTIVVCAKNVVLLQDDYIITRIVDTNAVNLFHYMYTHGYHKLILSENSVNYMVRHDRYLMIQYLLDNEMPVGIHSNMILKRSRSVNMTFLALSRGANPDDAWRVGSCHADAHSTLLLFMYGANPQLVPNLIKHMIQYYTGAIGGEGYSAEWIEVICIAIREGVRVCIEDLRTAFYNYRILPFELIQLLIDSYFNDPVSESVNEQINSSVWTDLLDLSYSVDGRWNSDKHHFQLVRVMRCLKEKETWKVTKTVREQVDDMIRHTNDL